MDGWKKKSGAEAPPVLFEKWIGPRQLKEAASPQVHPISCVHDIRQCVLRCYQN